jgi:hypothetical protein
LLRKRRQQKRAPANENFKKIIVDPTETENDQRNEAFLFFGTGATGDSSAAVLEWGNDDSGKLELQTKPIARALIVLFLVLCGLAHAKDTKEYQTGVISSVERSLAGSTPRAVPAHRAMSCAMVGFRTTAKRSAF